MACAREARQVQGTHAESRVRQLTGRNIARIRAAVTLGPVEVGPDDPDAPPPCQAADHVLTLLLPEHDVGGRLARP